jgi:hypothetical protein
MATTTATTTAATATINDGHDDRDNTAVTTAMSATTWP